jgi:hypothetical protein
VGRGAGSLPAVDWSQPLLQRIPARPWPPPSLPSLRRTFPPRKAGAELLRCVQGVETQAPRSALCLHSWARSEACTRGWRAGEPPRTESPSWQAAIPGARRGPEGHQYVHPAMLLKFAAFSPRTTQARPRRLNRNPSWRSVLAPCDESLKQICARMMVFIARSSPKFQNYGMELSQRKCVLMIAAQSRDAPLTRGAEPRRLEVG